MHESAEVGYITPAGIVFVLITMALMFVVKRKHAWFPLAISGCWMTLGQNIVLAGLNLPVLRIVLAAAMLRVLIRGEYRNIKFKTIDRVFLLWLLSATVTYVLLWQTGQSLVNRLGLVYNAIGMYFCLRAWLVDRSDVDRVARGFVYVLLVVAASMAVEKLTRRNAFAIFGGVPFATIVRDGKLRCQGPFFHPILAGTVGAVWFPVFLNMVLRSRYKFAGALGTIAAATIVITSRSSGPLLTMIIATGAMCLWPIRNHMRVFRWSVVGFLVLLQLAMKAPLWALLARLNVVSGSTGWHRSHLIEMSLVHFPQWFLVGAKDWTVASWGVHAGDITNHYLFEGLRGGFSTMVLFVIILALVFRFVGLGIQQQKRDPSDSAYYHSFWALGAMVGAHAATFISVAYFNPQIMLHWYFTLALVVAMYQGGPYWSEEEEEALPPRYVWWGQSQEWQPAATRTVTAAAATPQTSAIGF